MYILNPMPPQISAELISGLLESDTGTIGHFVDMGFMDPGIEAKMPGAKIAGTAVTVRVTVPDSVIGHYALKFIRPGDVLIIDRGQDRNTACWGGTTSVGASKAGMTGLIMDGAGNDIRQANEAGLPIWCRGVTPVTTKYRGLGGELNVPISCGGVSVTPGDAVLADENGIVILSPGELPRIIESARAFARKEADLLALLRDSPHVCYPDATGATLIVEEKLKSTR
jgi:4-hydroxy-4-methyl-2-oxoglutarate aldolase